MKLPKTCTETFYLTARPFGTVTLLSWKVANNDPDGYVVLSEHTFTVDVPQEDPTNKIIEALRKSQQTIRAEAGVKTSEIEERIQSLLALPNPENPKEESADDLPS